MNILGDAQGELCWSFARETTDKFVDLTFERTPATGSPLLPGVLAWIDCEIEKVLDAGDHWFVLGRVLGLDVMSEEGGPLLFFRGKLGGFVLGS